MLNACGSLASPSSILIKKFWQQIRRLSLHEWQSKQLLKKYGCTVQQFVLAENQKEASDKLISSFAKPGTEYVVKAQVLAGGRGKGRFIGGREKFGGVYVTTDFDDAISAVGQMAGKRLVTNQTLQEGVLVNKVMVAKGITIKRETYLAIAMDRECNAPVIVASPAGGMDIEAVAKTDPDKIFKEIIDIEIGVTNNQTERIAKCLEFIGGTVQSAAQQIKSLYDLFIDVDATLIEINPFVETDDGLVYCVDAKLTFDDNAAYRQQPIFAMEDPTTIDPREAEAQANELNYIPLTGNIACLVNGAGLAMATMDLIKIHKGMPANFLDVGGNASEKQITSAFKIICNDPQVEAILVNIFGGIVNCVTVAKGLTNAFKEVKPKIPLVVRLEGTNSKEAHSLLKSSNLPIIVADCFEEAALKAVNSANTAEKINV